jgi:hypothetical protein
VAAPLAMSTTMTMLASEHTIRLPSADQVPVGVDRHEISYTSGRSRCSVASVSATHGRSPGPPICGPDGCAAVDALVIPRG